MARSVHARLKHLAETALDEGDSTIEVRTHDLVELLLGHADRLADARALRVMLVRAREQVDEYRGETKLLSLALLLEEIDELLEATKDVHA